MKALEKMPQTLKASPGVPSKREPRKRTQETQIGKEFKARKLENEGRKTRTLKEWIQRRVEGPEIPAPDLEEIGTASLRGKEPP